MWPATWHSLVEVVIRTGVIYLFVLVGVRLRGKREVGQMTPFDLTLLLLLSNAVQNAMLGPDSSLLGGVVAAGTLLAMNYGVARFSGRSRRFRRFVQGSPTLLVHNGKAIPSHLERECVTMDELLRALREHGVCSIQEVSLAVLEVDGSISVLKYDDVPSHSVAAHPRLKFLQKHQ